MEPKKEHEIVFFVDKQQFTTEQPQLSVRTILQMAKEEPVQTTLVLKRGNEQIKYTNLDEILSLQNGMKFVVFHNTPTTVSNYVRT